MTALRVVGLIAIDSLALAVPLAVGALIATRLRVRHVLFVTGAALGGLAVHGAIAFWAYYFLGGNARYFVATATALEALTAVVIVVRDRQQSLEALSKLARPSALVVTSALFITAFGFLHGGHQAPLVAGQTRFLPWLPIDNEIPLILTHAVESDVRPLPNPLYGSWQASDRPPLQTGIYLGVTSIFGGATSELQYTVVGSILQCLWILGMWAFLAAARAARLLAALIITSLAFSGFVIVNSFFVWPKLLSSAFLLIVAAPFLAPRFRGILAERGCGVILGLSAGGALLSHEGAIFGLLALVLLACVQRRLPSWRVTLLGILSAILLVGPWTAYQKFGDPPGDTLLKWNIAGQVNNFTPHPFLPLLVDQYRALGARRAVHYKLENLAEPFRGDGGFLVDWFRVAESYVSPTVDAVAKRDTGVLDARTQQFFRLLPALGLLALGPLIFVLRAIVDLLYRRRVFASDDESVVVSLLLLLALSLVTWSLIMFGPGTTWLHQGTYLTPVLAFAVCVWSCWSVAPRFAFALVTLNVAGGLYLYTAAPAAAGHVLFGPVDGSLLAVVVLAFLATLAQLFVPAIRNLSADEDIWDRRRVGAPQDQPASATAALLRRTS